MFAYRLLSVLALLAYAPYALVRSLAGRRRLGDLRGRLGLATYPELRGGIWIHAVSVGEVGVARSLLASLAKADPGQPLGLSVTTAAGRQLAHETASKGVPVFAFPFDLARPIEKALSAVRPGLVLLTETEIWPLFLERASARGIPVALVNGRVSLRSYARYRLGGRFFSRALERISLFAMQSAEDADRIRSLGAPGNRIHVVGNVKYDRPAAPSFPDDARLRAAAAGRPVFVAASTGEGEEQIVLEALRAATRRPLLVLAPRRPERFDDVARLVESHGLSLLRRSSPDFNHKSQITNHKSPDVYLLDSIGELASVYRGACLAFIGGSLVPTGGHNPIEAWAEGVPVVTGPYVGNFREVAANGIARGFLRSVRDATELAAEIAACLADPRAAAARGESARKFVACNRGAADATARLVLPLLETTDRERMAAP